jgi:hypothetical protein
VATSASRASPRSPRGVAAQSTARDDADACVARTGKPRRQHRGIQQRLGYRGCIGTGMLMLWPQQSELWGQALISFRASCAGMSVKTVQTAHGATTAPGLDSARVRTSHTACYFGRGTGPCASHRPRLVSEAVQLVHMEVLNVALTVHNASSEVPSKQVQPIYWFVLIGLPLLLSAVWMVQLLGVPHRGIDFSGATATCSD